MFPSLGLFKNDCCPADQDGCSRPYCHFCHLMNPYDECAFEAQQWKPRAGEPLDMEQPSDLDTSSNLKENLSSHSSSQSEDNLEILQKLITDVVKKVITESSMLDLSNINPAKIVKNFDAKSIIAQAVQEVSSNQDTKPVRQVKLYLPPPGIPNYKPTPIIELNRKNMQSSDLPYHKNEEYTPAVIASPKKVVEDGELTDFSSPEEDNNGSLEFDLLEEVLAEQSSDPNRCKAILKRKKELHKKTVKGMTEKLKPNVDPNISIAKELIETCDYTFLPPSPLFTSSSSIEQKNTGSCDYRSADAECLEMNSETNSGGILSMDVSEPVPQIGHGYLPQISSLSKPNLKVWKPVAKPIPKSPVSLESIEMMLEKLHNSGGQGKLTSCYLDNVSAVSSKEDTGTETNVKSKEDSLERNTSIDGSQVTEEVERKCFTQGLPTTGDSSLKGRDLTSNTNELNRLAEPSEDKKCKRKRSHNRNRSCERKVKKLKTNRKRNRDVKERKKHSKHYSSIQNDNSDGKEDEGKQLRNKQRRHDERGSHHKKLRHVHKKKRKHKHSKRCSSSNMEVNSEFSSNTHGDALPIDPSKIKKEKDEADVYIVKIENASNHVLSSGISSKKEFAIKVANKMIEDPINSVSESGSSCSSRNNSQSNHIKNCNKKCNETQVEIKMSKGDKCLEADCSLKIPPKVLREVSLFGNLEEVETSYRLNRRKSVLRSSHDSKNNETRNNKKFSDKDQQTIEKPHSSKHNSNIEKHHEQKRNNKRSPHYSHHSKTVASEEPCRSERHQTHVSSKHKKNSREKGLHKEKEKRSHRNKEKRSHRDGMIDKISRPKHLSIDDAGGSYSPIPDLSSLNELPKEEWDQILNFGDLPSSPPKENDYHSESDDGVQSQMFNNTYEMEPSSEEDNIDAHDPRVLVECMKVFSEYNPTEDSTLALSVKPKLIDSADDSKDTVSGQRVRIARQGATGNMLMKPKALVKPLRKTPSEVMLERYQKLQEQERELKKKMTLQLKEMEHHIKVVPLPLPYSSPSLVSSSSDFFTPSSAVRKPPKKCIPIAPANVAAMLKGKEEIRKLQMLRVTSVSSSSSSAVAPSQPNPTIAMTHAKGERRIAHVPTNMDPIERPTINVLERTKVPHNIRQRYLNCFIDETLKFCDSKGEAFRVAVAEERICHQRATSRVVYLNIAVNVVKKLRSFQISEAAKELLEKEPDCTGSIMPPLDIAAASPKPAFIHPINPNHNVISHSSMLATGGNKGSWSIEKTKKTFASNPQDYLLGCQFYRCLKKYILTCSQLEENGFPRPDPLVKGKAKMTNSRKKVSPSDTKRYCARCSVLYEVDQWGIPIICSSCVHHWGRPYKQRGFGGLQTRYSCCHAESQEDGCCLASTHVSENFSPDSLSGYVRTFPKETRDPDGYGVFALDCEMCYTTAGCELVRVTVVDPSKKSIYETLVLPENPIIDYNTRFSGITEKDMEGVKVTIRDVQAALLTLFSEKTILIGHSLESDFAALKIIHDTVVDTSTVFPHKLGAPYKRALRNLASELLNKIIQNDVSGHDSAEDAVSCMELMQWKIKEDLKGTPILYTSGVR